MYLQGCLLRAKSIRTAENRVKGSNNKIESKTITSKSMNRLTWRFKSLLGTQCRMTHT